MRRRTSQVHWTLRHYPHLAWLPQRERIALLERTFWMVARDRRVWPVILAAGSIAVLTLHYSLRHPEPVRDIIEYFGYSATASRLIASIVGLLAYMFVAMSGLYVLNVLGGRVHDQVLAREVAKLNAAASPDERPEASAGAGEKQCE